MEPIKVLICDDHPFICRGIGGLLEGEKDIKVLGEACKESYCKHIPKAKYPY